MRELDKGKYADAGDIYVDHEVVRDGFEVFLVSNKRVMYIAYHQVLGNWSVEWEFLHKDLSQELPPTVEKPQSDDDCWHLIVNPLEPKRKVLGLFGGVSGKRINMRTREAAQNLARKICALQREQREHAS